MWPAGLQLDHAALDILAQTFNLVRQSRNPLHSVQEHLQCMLIGAYLLYIKLTERFGIVYRTSIDRRKSKRRRHWRN